MSILYSARARSTTRTSIHDFRRDIGRHGLIDTVSPSLHSLPSSCASNLVVRRTYLPYMGCLTRRSTETAMVLSILLLTTLPVSSRCPGTGAAPGARCASPGWAAPASVDCTSLDITNSPGASRRIYGVDVTPTYRARFAGRQSWTHLGLGEHRLHTRNVLTHL